MTSASRRSAALLALLALGACAAPPPPAGPSPATATSVGLVYAQADVDQHPALLDASAPGVAMRANYPQLLLDADVSGEVRVSFVVTADGRTNDVRVISSTADPFRQASLRVIAGLRFRPAMRAGQPVAVRVTRTLDWRPRDSTLR